MRITELPMRPLRVYLRGVIMIVSVVGLASGDYFEVEGRYFPQV